MISGQVVAKCPKATADIVDQYVKAAADAQSAWGETTALDRGKVLHKVADLIRVS